MQTLFPLIECCVTPVTPEFFLMRLKEYAKTENCSLEQAAEMILPFTQVFNCILLTTVVGCILQRADLISPAAQAYIYRAPLLRLSQTLTLPAHLKKPNHRLTKMMIDMINPAVYTHLLLAHSGIVAFNQDDQAVCTVLRINQDRAFLLEAYVAEHGLPQAFLTTAVQLTSLSSEHLNHYLGLICAADRYQTQLAGELDELVRHLATQGAKASYAMHLLASHPMESAKLLASYRHDKTMTDFCVAQQWQLGRALMWLNENDRAMATPFFKEAHVSQACIWLIAAAILQTPIKQFNMEARTLNQALTRAMQHRHLLLRFDDAEGFAQTLKTQQPLPLTIKLDAQSVHFLLDSIERDLADFNKHFFQAFMRAVLLKLKEQALPNIGLSALLFVTLELIQNLIQYTTSIMDVKNGTCESVDVQSIFTTCISCNIFNQHLPWAAIPETYIANSWQLNWIKQIIAYRNKPCLGDHYTYEDVYREIFLKDNRIFNSDKFGVVIYEINGKYYEKSSKQVSDNWVNCNVRLNNVRMDPLFLDRFLRDQPWICQFSSYYNHEGLVCLPTCQELKSNTLPLADYYRSFYYTPPLDPLPQIALAVGIIYCAGFIAIIARVLTQAYFSVHFVFQPLLEKMLDKLNIYIQLLCTTHYAQATQPLKNTSDKLQTLCLVSSNHQSLQLARDTVKICKKQLADHPVSLELKKNIAIVAIDEMQQAKMSTVTQTLWHYDTRSKPKVQYVNADHLEALYYV